MGKESSVKYANTRHVKISNTDLPLLVCVQTILSRVSIDSTIYLDHPAGTRNSKKDAYILVISDGRSLLNYLKLVGFTNPVKAAKLAKIVASYKRFQKKG